MGWHVILSGVYRNIDWLLTVDVYEQLFKSIINYSAWLNALLPTILTLEHMKKRKELTNSSLSLMPLTLKWKAEGSPRIHSEYTTSFEKRRAPKMRKLNSLSRILPFQDYSRTPSNQRKKTLLLKKQRGKGLNKLVILSRPKLFSEQIMERTSSAIFSQTATSLVKTLPKGRTAPLPQSLEPETKINRNKVYFRPATIREPRAQACFLTSKAASFRRKM